MMKVLSGMTVGLISLSVMLGCESRTPTAEKKPSNAAEATATATMPAGLMLEKAPDGPLEVAAAKQSAKEGDEIVIRGRIGGGKHPFVNNRAMFQLVDSSVPTCDEKGSDGCPTPWDYCCEPKDQVAAKSATVQVTDAEGKPLALNLDMPDGLQPQDTVIVKGKVAKKPNEATMIVTAAGIYVQR